MLWAVSSGKNRRSHKARRWVCALVGRGKAKLRRKVFQVGCRPVRPVRRDSASVYILYKRAAFFLLNGLQDLKMLFYDGFNDSQSFAQPRHGFDAGRLAATAFRRGLAASLMSLQ